MYLSLSEYFEINSQFLKILISLEMTINKNTFEYFVVFYTYQHSEIVLNWLLIIKSFDIGKMFYYLFLLLQNKYFAKVKIFSVRLHSHVRVM